MNKATSIYLSLVLFAVCQLSQAQTSGLDWLQKSVGVLNVSKSISVNLTMKVIAGGLTGELLETTSSTIKKMGPSTFSDFGQLITIQNEGKVLIVDKTNQEIIISQNAAKGDAFDYSKIYTDLKPYIDTVYISTRESGFVDIVCKYKAAIGVPYTRIDIRLNESTILPVIINMYMADGIAMYEDELQDRKPIIQLNYSNWQLNEMLNTSVFNLENYAIKKGGQWIVSPAYKDYEITILN